MKDKRQKQMTINDLVQSHKINAAPTKRELDFEDDVIEASLISQEDLNDIYEYNANLTQLDEDYKKVVPMSKILVRVFLHEPGKSEHGLLEPHRQLIPIQTNAGVGTLMEIESPFPYSNKAVVVAVPNGYISIQPGNLIQLESNPIKPIANGSGANARIHIPLSYMHPSAPSLEIPQNCKNKHYGYLLIPFHEISTIYG